MGAVIRTLEIAAEAPDDREAVHGVNRAAFGGSVEAGIVDALRHADPRNLSLVAREGGAVVGHIFFTPVTVGPEGWSALALGPMAVAPERQRAGIGSALVRAGLDACRAQDQPIVFVLGHPAYYPRFGFVPAPPLGLTSEFPVPDEVFMVAELAAGALAGRRGVVRYHPRFQTE